MRFSFWLFCPKILFLPFFDPNSSGVLPFTPHELKELAGVTLEERRASEMMGSERREEGSEETGVCSWAG